MQRLNFISAYVRKVPGVLSESAIFCNDRMSFHYKAFCYFLNIFCFLSQSYHYGSRRLCFPSSLKPKLRRRPLAASARTKKASYVFRWTATFFTSCFFQVMSFSSPVLVFFPSLTHSIPPSSCLFIIKQWCWKMESLRVSWGTPGLKNSPNMSCTVFISTSSCFQICNNIIIFSLWKEKNNSSARKKKENKPNGKRFNLKIQLNILHFLCLGTLLFL